MYIYIHGYVLEKRMIEILWSLYIVYKNVVL